MSMLSICNIYSSPFVGYYSFRSQELEHNCKPGLLLTRSVLRWHRFPSWLTLTHPGPRCCYMLLAPRGRHRAPTIASSGVRTSVMRTTRRRLTLPTRRTVWARVITTGCSYLLSTIWYKMALCKNFPFCVCECTLKTQACKHAHLSTSTQMHTHAQTTRRVHTR